jgi:DNA-binding NarL/FixJ family response regulator
MLVYDIGDDVVRDMVNNIDRKSEVLVHVGLPIDNWTEAIARVPAEAPHVALIDMGLPRLKRGLGTRGEGVACAETIHRLSPTTMIVMISVDPLTPETSAECALVKRLEAIGVLGYLYGMEMTYGRYAEYIASAARRLPVFSSRDQLDKWRDCLAARDHVCFADGPGHMTEREHQAMVLMARDSLQYREIGEMMGGLSADTIQGYVSKAGTKVGAWPGRPEFARWAFEHCPDCALPGEK